MRKELYESPVVFSEEHHTYTLNGKELQGVTPIIAWLFPDTYAGIPEFVLNQAAEYGSLIHKKCELYDNIGVCDCTEVATYKKLINEHGLIVERSEYLVSDGKNIASSIDKVFHDDSLGDIKTTSKVHELNVTIQLSIYAWLYEQANGCKVPHLYLIWLPKPQYGTAEIYEMQRIPAQWCEKVVERFIAGADPTESVAELAEMGFVPTAEKKRVEGEIPDSVLPLVDELIIIKKQMDVLDEREKEIRKAILDAMTGKGEDKWSNDLIQFSHRAESTRESIDSKALKAKMPEVYESFKKVTKVAASLTYKIL